MILEEWQMDNILQRQKAEIINLIDAGKIDEALTVLRILEPLWDGVTPNYSYKRTELLKRANDWCEANLPET
jgi:hypothetical protein